MLPKQRQEFYMAQNSYMVTASMGGYKGEIADFMLKTGDTDEEEQTEVGNDDASFAESELDKLA